MAYHRRKGGKPMVEYKRMRKKESAKRNGQTCKRCGKFFIRHRGGNKTDGSGSFCSRKCWGIWRSAQESNSSMINGYYPGAKCKIYFNNCEYCSLLYTSRYKTKRFFCCEDHRRKQSKKDYYDNHETILKQKRDEYKAGWVPPKPFICEWCGKVHQPEFGDTSTVYCSNRCQKRALKYGSEPKQRAESLGVYYEPVDPIKVFIRDGWRCQLCGKKLRKEDKGTYKDNAPELDHIITWAEGGEHSYRNTQCACRKCNGNKGAVTIGQFRMFG